jgi:hypothetical protein
LGNSTHHIVPAAFIAAKTMPEPFHLAENIILKIFKRYYCAVITLLYNHSYSILKATEQKAVADFTSLATLNHCCSTL